MTYIQKKCTDCKKVVTMKYNRKRCGDCERKKEQAKLMRYGR